MFTVIFPLPWSTKKKDRQTWNITISSKNKFGMIVANMANIQVGHTFGGTIRHFCKLCNIRTIIHLDSCWKLELLHDQSILIQPFTNLKNRPNLLKRIPPICRPCALNQAGRFQNPLPNSSIWCSSAGTPSSLHRERTMTNQISSSSKPSPKELPEPRCPGRDSPELEVPTNKFASVVWN